MTATAANSNLSAVQQYRQHCNVHKDNLRSFTSIRVCVYVFGVSQAHNIPKNKKKTKNNILYFMVENVRLICVCVGVRHSLSSCYILSFGIHTHRQGARETETLPSLYRVHIHTHTLNVTHTQNETHRNALPNIRWMRKKGGSTRRLTYIHQIMMILYSIHCVFFFFLSSFFGVCCCSFDALYFKCLFCMVLSFFLFLFLLLIFTLYKNHTLCMPCIEYANNKKKTHRIIIINEWTLFYEYVHACVYMFWFQFPFFFTKICF